MSGYYDTRKRDLTENTPYSYKPKGSNDWVRNQPLYQPGSQVTTSYRTGDQAKADEWDYFNTHGKAIRTEVPVSQFDRGHVFTTVKQYVSLSHPKVDLRGRSANNPSRYIGPLIPLATGDVARHIVPSTWSQFTINDFGNKAISRTYPTKSKADLLGAITELLRDGLPDLPSLMLIRDRGTQLRTYGGEMLNYAFAWQPLISDLRKIVESLMDSTRILLQLEKDSGKVVRRRLRFPLSSETTFVNPDSYIGRGVFMLESWTNDDIPLAGSTLAVQVRDFRSESIWFSGAYSYYLSPGITERSRFVRFLEMGDHLLGIGLTPDKLWNLSPWSWLADWIVDIGSAISTASAFQKNGLVLRYGYLMRQTTAQRTLEATGMKLPVGTVSRTFVTERKERFRSTPFGFGVSAASLTPAQIAILSALGMSGSGRVAF